MEPIEGSETSAFKTQTPGKTPQKNILHIRDMLPNKYLDNFLFMEILFLCLIIISTDYGIPAATKQENYSHTTIHGFCTPAAGQI